MKRNYSPFFKGVLATVAATSMAVTPLVLTGCNHNQEPTNSIGPVATVKPTATNSIVNSNYNQPNIIFILLDDTGVSDFGCYGNTFNETPNIDKIASAGTRFTSYYTQPVCSPSRSCALTGYGTLRTGITNFLDAQNSVYLSNQEFALTYLSIYARLVFCFLQTKFYFPHCYMVSNLFFHI